MAYPSKKLTAPVSPLVWERDFPPGSRTELWKNPPFLGPKSRLVPKKSHHFWTVRFPQWSRGFFLGEIKMVISEMPR